MLTANPEVDHVFFAALRDVLPLTMFSEFEHKFNVGSDLRVRQLLASKQTRDVIEIIHKEKDVDTLREIAVQVFGSNISNLFRQSFDLSRVHFHFSPTDRLQRLQLFKNAIITPLPEIFPFCDEVENILQKSEAKAMVIAEKTLSEVRTKMGL